jgi:lysine 2,3-aminomutase
MTNIASNTLDKKKLQHANPKYVTKVADLTKLSDAEREQLAEVENTYRFRANDYYLSLIDWNDPDDPIRHLIVPHIHELNEWGKLDPSEEHKYTILPGLEHKYHSTALLLVSNVCGAICRYCFRKRVFLQSSDDILKDLPAALDYIREHREITNILLTGGDPLVLSTNKLRNVIEPLLQIDHVRIIRLGSKIPAFNPQRILNDPELLDLMRQSCTDTKQLYTIVHFNHANELSDVALQTCKAIHQTGAVLANQTPLIRRVNDSAEALADLFRKLSFVGIPPYYVFQCRPASGNQSYAVPIEEGFQIFEQARAKTSGLGKRARFVMSHATGKIEIVGLTREHIYFKYQRAAKDADSSRFLVCKRNPDAYWLDDYDPPLESHPLDCYQ